MRACNKYSYFSQGEKYEQMSHEGKARVWHLNLSTETRSVEVDKWFISQTQGNTVRPLYNAVLGGTEFLSQKPRYREVRVIERVRKCFGMPARREDTDLIQ